MASFASKADIMEIERAEPWPDVAPASTLYQLLSQTAARHPNRTAISFQLFSGASDPAVTLSWADFHSRVTQAANLFRSLGVGETDTVAYVLPNCNETPAVLLGGAVAGGYAR